MTDNNIPDEKTCFNLLVAGFPTVKCIGPDCVHHSACIFDLHIGAVVKEYIAQNPERAKSDIIKAWRKNDRD